MPSSRFNVLRHICRRGYLVSILAGGIVSMIRAETTTSGRVGEVAMSPWIGRVFCWPWPAKLDPVWRHQVREPF